MKYSLICPTRNRTKNVRRLLTSIRDTVANPQDMEILFAMDNDDAPTHQFFHVLKTQNEFPTLNIQTHIREHSMFLNRDYYNWLASKSIGQYIFVSADDVVYLVPDWDKIIAERIEAYLSNKPDRIICVGIKDNTPKPKASLPQFPCFPLITREAYNFFGFVLQPEVPTWGADYLSYLLYTGADRYMCIDDQTYMEHISWHTKQTTEDATGANIRKTFSVMQRTPAHNVDYVAQNVIPIHIDKLKKHIYGG